MCGGRLGLAGCAPGGANPRSGAGLLERGLDQVGRGRGGPHRLNSVSPFQCIKWKLNGLTRDSSPTDQTFSGN